MAPVTELLASGWVKGWLVPGVLGALVASAAWLGARWFSAEHVPSLSSVPLFGGLSPRQIRSLAGLTRRVEFPPREAIVRQGDVDDAFYLVEGGQALILVGEEEKAVLRPGGYFGEMASIDHAPRSASVIAQTPVVALQLPSSALVRLIHDDASIRRALSIELRQRLGREGAAVPEGEPQDVTPQDLVDLCRRLRDTQTPDWGEFTPRRRRLRLV